MAKACGSWAPAVVTRTGSANPAAATRPSSASLRRPARPAAGWTLSATTTRVGPISRATGTSQAEGPSPTKSTVAV